MVKVGDLLVRMQRLINLIMDWVFGGTPYKSDIDIKSPRELLRFWYSVGGHAIELGFFASIAWSTWLRYSCSKITPIQEWLKCSWQAFLPCGLILLIAFVYIQSRHSAKVELSIAEKLFPAGRLPNQWIGRKDPIAITVSVMAYFALYAGLAWVSDNIRLVSLFMLVIACIDFNTRRLINTRIRAYFDDAKYAPDPDNDKDYELIEKRRTVVRKFLYERPHLWKEAGRVTGCATAFSAAICGYLYSIEWMKLFSYLFLMLTLFSNELVTWWWRRERYHWLLDAEKMEPDTRTTNETVKIQ